MKQQNDWLTVASIGLIAMCVVTADHEAFGHGGACLALHGHITFLTSSIFHCSARSPWIDPAGPFGNLLGGTIALVIASFVPVERVALRLLLLCVTAFSFFWEGGYLAQAMIKRSGDLYFFAQFILGGVTEWKRWAFVVVAILFYLFTARLVSRGLLALWPDPPAARRVARIVWLSATLGAGLAALAFRGHAPGNLRDAVLEIGAASLALLFIPRGQVSGEAKAAIVRDYRWVALALVVFAVFTATLGRGTGAWLAA